MKKRNNNFKRTTRDVEGEREMTHGLNVSNNSAENIISQGRFECLAYNKIFLVAFTGKDE